MTDESPPAEASATPEPQPPRRKKPRRSRRTLVVVTLSLLGAILLTAGVGLMTVFSTLDAWRSDLPEVPSAEELWSLRRTPGMTFLDRNGAVISTRGPRYGRAVRLNELPLHVRRAFLAAEDVRFYEHGPVDYEAMARALWTNVRAGRTVEGASTLSQQLARTLFLTRDETIKRKVQEWMLAERLENMLGKDGVFELYLNRTFFGDNEYGLEAAARGYFSKSARELTLAEAALLAAVPNAPSRLALTNDWDGAIARSHRILAIMREEGWITAAQELEAHRNPPVLNRPDPPVEAEFAWVIDLAGRQAAEHAQGAASDLVVRLTVDPELQREGAEILRAAIAGEGVRRNATQGALVVLAPDGAIRVMVGGVDYGSSVFNRAAQARRQPGSAFKPIVFAAALERGVSPYDTREDTPIRIGRWTPGNYGGGFSGGRVSIRDALARSTNTVAVRLGLEVGAGAIADFSRRFGLTSIPANAGPSIALGAYEVTPLQLAGAFQVFQTGGSRTTPYLISEISDTRGNVIWAMHPGAGVPVYDRDRASQMVRMMQGVITRGTGQRANIGRPAAGKTGTSQNWRDAWFVGFTPDYLAAVWVGNDNGRSMSRVTGGEIPATIWRRFMQRAHRGVEVHDFDWLTPETVPIPEYVASEGDPYAEDMPYTDGEGENPYDDPLQDPPRFDEDPPPMPPGMGPIYESEPTEYAEAPPRRRRRDEEEDRPRPRFRPPPMDDEAPVDEPYPGYEDEYADEPRPVYRNRY